MKTIQNDIVQATIHKKIKLEAEATFASMSTAVLESLNAVDNALAQQRLEGLDVQPDIIEDMKRAARGEIGLEEGIRNTIKRYNHA